MYRNSWTPWKSTKIAHRLLEKRLWRVSGRGEIGAGISLFRGWKNEILSRALGLYFTNENTIENRNRILNFPLSIVFLFVFWKFNRFGQDKKYEINLKSALGNGIRSPPSDPLRRVKLIFWEDLSKNEVKQTL